jgi:hypothetical protein
MPTAVSRSRAVSLSFAILAAMYLGMAAFLVSLAWAGSLKQLWRDVPLISGLVIPSLGLSALHLALSVLTFHFPDRSILWRRAILGTAALLFVLTCLRSSLTLVEWLNGWPLSAFSLPGGILTLGYGLCVWSLWRAHATANYRLERP